MMTVVATPATRYAQSGDASIAYQVIGDGPVDLVLVWGTMSHVELFWEDPFTSYFLERLASFSRLILFDKRGCGLSDRFSNQPTLEDRMDDVRAVMDAVGSERAVIFGESEGGPMSILFAATYPGRTVALVLYGAIARWVDETFEGAWRPQDFAEMVEQFAQGWGRGDVISWFAPSFAKLAPDVVAEAGGKFERSAMSPGAFRQLAAMNADIDVRSIAGSIMVPTLIMHRTGDHVIDVRQGRWLRDHIPGSTYIEFEGDDHLLSAGDPEPILVHTEEFVTGNRSSPVPERAGRDRALHRHRRFHRTRGGARGPALAGRARSPRGHRSPGTSAAPRQGDQDHWGRIPCDVRRTGSRRSLCEQHQPVYRNRRRTGSGRTPHR